jgi:hypothetical protein
MRSVSCLRSPQSFSSGASARVAGGRARCTAELPDLGTGRQGRRAERPSEQTAAASRRLKGIVKPLSPAQPPGESSAAGLAGSGSTAATIIVAASKAPDTCWTSRSGVSGASAASRHDRGVGDKLVPGRLDLNVAADRSADAHAVVRGPAAQHPAPHRGTPRRQGLQPSDEMGGRYGVRRLATVVGEY